MGIPKGFKRTYFPRVAEAREALRERALELFELQVQIIRQALLKGDFESAYKANEWLLAHMPPDEDGQRLVEGSVDNTKEITQGQGPSIRIGIAFGGIDKPKELPEPQVEIIDITPEKIDEPARS